MAKRFAVTSALVSIPMPDGVVLSGRLWLPELAAGERVPAILDCHPYRVTDLSAIGNERTFAYLAAHGYACLRVDLRGSGNSGGWLLDEYLAQEQADNIAVIEWAAGREWCDGSVGWTGISWSGFAGPQVAALRPPALKAVVSICSTDDRYADDVHYRGGSVLGSDMLPWASTMLMLNALPPDPLVVGEVWHEMWLERLRHTPSYIEQWLTHQTRDTFWKHGSVCEDFPAIETPVLIVGGWADGYTDAAFRLMEGLRSPWRAIIGPWAHGSPHETAPGPNIGFLQELLRWFDHWLKGIDTAVMAEAPLRAWIQEYVEPSPSYKERPGRWVGLDWPTGGNEKQVSLSADYLTDQPGAQAAISLRRELADGMEAGQWCPSGSPGDFPGDQQELDSLWASYTTAPLSEALDVLGNATVRLELSCDSAAAEVIVRLCNVAPDGASLLVSTGMLNLRHRFGNEAPADLVPRERFAVEVPLKAVGHRFARGQRIRVSVAAAYFPRVWPSPGTFQLTLHEGAISSLALPLLRTTSVEDVTFPPPEQAPPPPFEVLDGAVPSRRIIRDTITGTTRLEVCGGVPTIRLKESGIEFGSTSENHFQVTGNDPSSARVTCSNSTFRRRDEWQVRVETTSEMSTMASGFHVTTAVRAFEGDDLVHESERTWGIPRG